MTTWCKATEYAALYAAVVERDGMVCRWCGCAVWPDHATLDHVTPRSAGGENTLDNLVMACRRCNARRRRYSGTAGPITEAQLIDLMK